MEVLLWALEHGKWSLVRDILAWGEPLQEAQEEPFEELSCFYRRLEKNSRLESYFRSASLYMQRDRVIFTGYLTHEELRYLFPCCDVAIFPSTVIEAGPLVFLEALASSCFPVGTYFGGMRASIDSVAGRLSPAHAKCMKLSPEPEDTVADIITNVPKALVVADRYRDALRDIAVRRCDWENVARRLTRELRLLARR